MKDWVAVVAIFLLTAAGVGAGAYSASKDSEEYAHDKYVYGFAVGLCTGLQNATMPDLDEVHACADEYLRMTGQERLVGWGR